MSPVTIASASPGPTKPSTMRSSGSRHELGPEFVPDFLEDSLTRNQSVPLEAKLHNGFAETAGSHRCDEDVRIKDDPHERALNTSSSLSSP